MDKSNTVLIRYCSICHHLRQEHPVRDRFPAHGQVLQQRVHLDFPLAAVYTDAVSSVKKISDLFDLPGIRSTHIFREAGKPVQDAVFNREKVIGSSAHIAPVVKGITGYPV